MNITCLTYKLFLYWEKNVVVDIHLNTCTLSRKRDEALWVTMETSSLISFVFLKVSPFLKACVVVDETNFYVVFCGTKKKLL